MLYLVVIHKDADSDYGVTVPGLPYCFSAAATMEDALKEAVEAIECQLGGLLSDGEPIPAPKAMEERQNNPQYAGGVWAVVEVDISKLFAG